MRAPDLMVFVGRHLPARSGGEIYNTHLFQAAAHEGIAIAYVTLAEAPMEQWLAGRLVWRFKPLFRSLHMSWRAWRSSAPVFIDVWLAPYLWPWAMLTRRRCLLMVHHLRAHLETSRFRRWWIGWCEGLLINRASEILTVSESSKRQIVAALRSQVPIGTIHPGFERPGAEEISPTGDDKRIHLLFVGAVTRAKGVPDLLNALRLMPVDPPWVMHIAGNTEAEPETVRLVHQAITTLPEPDRVHVYGHVDASRLQALYADADVFVLPSHWEGYGIVLLEAMARGLPVVATTAGAIPEVVEHGRTGLLVTPGDEEALAGALTNMISDSLRRRQLGQAASEAANRHADWQQMEDSCRQWWQRLKGCGSLTAGM